MVNSRSLIIMAMSDGIRMYIATLMAVTALYRRNLKL